VKESATRVMDLPDACGCGRKVLSITCNGTVGEGKDKMPPYFGMERPRTESPRIGEDHRQLLKRGDIERLKRSESRIGSFIIVKNVQTTVLGMTLQGPKKV